jgi:hypothetical protein
MILEPVALFLANKCGRHVVVVVVVVVVVSVKGFASMTSTS